MDSCGEEALAPRKQLWGRGTGTHEAAVRKRHWHPQQRWEEALAPVRRGGPAPFPSCWPQKAQEWATSSCLQGRLKIQPESGCTSIPSQNPQSQSLAAPPPAGHRFTPPPAALEGVVRRARATDEYYPDIYQS